MKVLHICSHYNNYKDNISPFIRSQGNSLKKKGLDIDYFTIKNKGFLGLLKNIVYLKNYTSKFRYDIIHTHGHASLLLPFVQSESKFISYMGNEIVGDYDFSGKITFLSLFKSFLTRSMSYFADCVIVKSQSMLNFFPNYSKKKFKILPNGVNTKNFRPLDKNKVRSRLNLDLNNKLVLFGASRRRPVKNYKLAHRSFQNLPKQDFKFYFLEGISHKCMPYLLNASDILVLTSYFEGSPNIVKEAISCGLPVISVDVGDVKERINGIENCQIVAPEAKSISQAIIKNSQNIRSNKSLSNQKISMEFVSTKLMTLYKQFR